MSLVVRSPSSRYAFCARRTLLIAGALSVGGCIDAFDPQSELSGARVLAVRPSPASGSPGADVTLDMLETHGTVPPAADGAPLQIVWLGGCHNPPGRQYYTCLPLLREIAKYLDPNDAAATSLEGAPPGIFGVGPQFRFSLPDDILSGALRVSTDPVHYGVSYVFFAACAGTLRPRPDLDDRIPLECVDAAGKPLGNRDFVVGFTTYFTYEGVQNQSPLLGGVEFAGKSLAISASSGSAQRSCSEDAECSDSTDAEDQPFACSDTGVCAPVVQPCSKGSCREYRLWPEVDASTAELLPDGQHEIAWVNFYATGGEMNSDTQLVVDRKLGLLDGYSTRWKPPEAPGTVRLFLTLNDQRGGADWSSFDVIVRSTRKSD